MDNEGIKLNIVTCTKAKPNMITTTTAKSNFRERINTKRAMLI